MNIFFKDPSNIFLQQNVIDDIKSNLFNLLNAKVKSQNYPPQKNLLSYGLNNFNLPFSNRELFIKELVKEITQTIQTFEPRLHSIHIHVIDFKNNPRNIVKLKISGYITLASSTKLINFEPELTLKKNVFSFGKTI